MGSKYTDPEIQLAQRKTVKNVKSARAAIQKSDDLLALLNIQGQAFGNSEDLRLLGAQLLKVANRRF
jgi:hypothetical protein